MKTIDNDKSWLTAPLDYETPAVEILEVVVEKGFAISDDPRSPRDPDDIG